VFDVLSIEKQGRAVGAAVVVDRVVRELSRGYEGPLVLLELRSEADVRVGGWMCGFY